MKNSNFFILPIISIQNFEISNLEKLFSASKGVNYLYTGRDIVQNIK